MKYALDTETGPFDPSKKQTNSYALEPYREEFYVKLVCIIGEGHESVTREPEETRAALLNLEKPVVYCHNAIFDISVLIRHVGYDDIKSIEFRDTGLLAKWINNSQKDEHFRYSLKNCIAKWMEDHPDTEKFISMKDHMEDDDEYWLKRVIFDTSMTLELATTLEKLLPPDQRLGYLTECRCLVPLARGYMRGIKVDYDVVEYMAVMYGAKVNKGLRELNIAATVVRSPKQLANLVFNRWGIEPEGMTPSGNPSTNASNLKLMLLKSEDQRLATLLEVKSAITVVNKYINGFLNTREYGKSEVMHPVPRLFNSYTGRMSYTSKIMKKYQVGIALHQLPRKDKLVKKAMVAPKGYKFFYADFAAQEMRLMAQFSEDPVMLQAFIDGKDLHSIMTEGIYGTPYVEIMEKKETVDEIIDQRNCGKLTNLSSQYRIGAKSLQTKFFEQYNKIVTLRESTHYLNTYKKTYRKVPKFWDIAISRVRKNRYSESLMGRRFAITNLDWKGESSSINQPIQGSGADLSEIVIAEVHDKFEEAIFQIQVHDSLTWIVPEEFDVKELDEFINGGIDFQKYFNTELLLKFPLDSASGYNLGELK